jgi:hypothetical protein
VRRGWRPTRAAAASRPEAAATTVSARTPVARPRRGSGGRLPRRSLVVLCGSDSATGEREYARVSSRAVVSGWSTRRSLACGCAAPAKDCLPGSVAGAHRVLGTRRDRPAGESWAPSPPTDRQAVNAGTITRHFGIRLPRLQGPLQRPTTGSLTPPEQAAPRGAPPTPARAPPRSQPRSSCGPRPARAGRSGDAARRPASDPGRLKAPTHDLDYLVAPAAQQGL